MTQHVQDLVVVMPARNEATTVGAVVREVKDVLRIPVVVIDDASTDATASEAEAAGATVLPLRIRLGAWGATQTGIRYALRQGWSRVVTMDADGQHLADKIPGLLEPLDTGRADVAIGACPQRASRARRLAWSGFRAMTGIGLEDLTSGFRAYNRAAMEVLASRNATLLDHQDIGVLLLLRFAGLVMEEIPVTMRPRTVGHSRVFSSWFVVADYLLQTAVLCLARQGRRPRKRAPVSH